MNMHKDRAYAKPEPYTCRLRKLSSQWNEKVFWGAKVFTQRCVIKKKLLLTKPLKGCSFKCLRREGMFFFSQLAFNIGQKGGDLAKPAAEMG